MDVNLIMQYVSYVLIAIGVMAFFSICDRPSDQVLAGAGQAAYIGGSDRPEPGAVPGLSGGAAVLAETAH